MVVLLPLGFDPLAFALESLAVSLVVRFETITKVINIERCVAEENGQNGCDLQCLDTGRQPGADATRMNNAS